MIALVIIYIAFLAFYLPLNFYIVYRVNEMRLLRDRSSSALIFFIGAMALIVLLSFINIALTNWSQPLNIIKPA